MLSLYANTIFHFVNTTKKHLDFRFVAQSTICFLMYYAKVTEVSRHLDINDIWSNLVLLKSFNYIIAKFPAKELDTVWEIPTLPNVCSC